MNWYIKMARTSLSDALQQLGLSFVPTKAELTKLQIRLNREHHPVRGGSNAILAKLNDCIGVVQQAIEQGATARPEPYTRPSRPSPSWATGKKPMDEDEQEGSDWENMWGESRAQQQQRSRVPEWQTDLRSSYNNMGADWRDINRCKHDIWAMAKKRAPTVQDWTFMAFDGAYIRGTFTAKCNEQTLSFGADVMEFWNSKGANPYRTEAVIASQQGRVWQLISVRGSDFSKAGITIPSNANPGNDPHFIAKLKDILARI